jgi:hypothetical protein
MVVFTIGVVAIVVEIVLFASGVRHMPLWLNLAVLLAPIGLGIGLFGLIIGARREGAEP